jgi:hypothetical protein
MCLHKGTHIFFCFILQEFILRINQLHLHAYGLGEAVLTVA